MMTKCDDDCLRLARMRMMRCVHNYVITLFCFLRVDHPGVYAREQALQSCAVSEARDVAAADAEGSG